MRSKSLLFVALVVLTIALPVVSNHPLHADEGEPAALTGRVSSVEEGPMEGVLVSARKAASIVTTTVVTDREGRYRFPASRVGAGQYALRIRAVGYELVGTAGAVSIRVGAQKTTVADLKLQKTHDLAAQLTNAEWL